MMRRLLVGLAVLGLAVVGSVLVLVLAEGHPLRAVAGYALALLAVLLVTHRLAAYLGPSSAFAVGAAATASGVVVLAVGADAAGVGLTRRLWIVVGGAALVLLAVTAGSGRGRSASAVRQGPGWSAVACGLTALALGTASIAVTFVSARDARRAEAFVAVSVVPAGATQVELEVTNRAPGAVQYVVQIGRGASVDLSAARLSVPAGGTVVRRLPVRPGRGVVRVAVRAGDERGPIVRRLEVELF